MDPSDTVMQQSAVIQLYSYTGTSVPGGIALRGTSLSITSHIDGSPSVPGMSNTDVPTVWFLGTLAKWACSLGTGDGGRGRKGKLPGRLVVCLHVCW